MADPFFVSIRVVGLLDLIIHSTATHGPLGGPIAQSAEHRADNAGVSGAIPLRPTILHDLFFEELIRRENL